MQRLLQLIGILTVLTLLMALPARASKLDAPDTPRSAATPGTGIASYAQALKLWKSIVDINQWIDDHFSYDMERALRLSETQRNSGPRTAIMTPGVFFQNPHGVCVDLARFGVETACRVAPQAKAAYLMINFEPVVVKGNILRRHWLAVFKAERAYYSFADSKRPGHIAGPYASLAELVNDYQDYRQRKVVSFKVLNDFRKKNRRKVLKKKKKSPDGW